MEQENLALIGRLIFGGFFLIASIRNFANFGERVKMPTNYGFLLPAPIVAIGFLMQLLGGLSLIVNVSPVSGCLLLIAFLVLATALYHNPLMFTGTERAPHLYLFLVNCTLAGGLLLVIADAL